MQRSRIRKRQPKLSNSQLASWKNKISKKGGSELKEKKVRTFNHYSHSNKGRIRLDPDTWINYDYGREYPVIKLHKKGKGEEEKKKDEFTLGKYPTLHSIIEETTPKVDQDQLREMDLFIIRDLNQGLLWKNKNFEFH